MNESTKKYLKKIKDVKTKDNVVKINGKIYHQIEGYKEWFYCGDCNESY